MLVLLLTSYPPVEDAATYTTHNKHETNRHSFGGIRTCDSRNQAAASQALDRTGTGIAMHGASETIFL